MDNSKPAICCLGYNRPDSLKRLLNSIKNARYPDESVVLIISIDKGANSEDVYNVAASFQWTHGEKKIIRHEKRLGGKQHAFECGNLTAEYGSIIYLEDDVVVAPNYYIYTVEALKFYIGDSHIFGIALYSQMMLFDVGGQFIPYHNGCDTYLFKGDISWGQCWTYTAWKKFKEWYSINENKIGNYCQDIPKGVYSWPDKSSWSKCIEYYMVENDVYYVVPYISYSSCMSEKGVHTQIGSDICQVPLSMKKDTNYTFFTFDKCIKYDAFHERENLNFKLNIDSNKICIDLYGGKYDWSGKKYILTTKELPYKVVSGYSCDLEPIELNVEYEISGDDILLYEIPDDYSPPYTIENIKNYRIRNRYRDKTFDRYLLKHIIPYTVKRCVNRLKLI